MKHKTKRHIMTLAVHAVITACIMATAGCENFFNDLVDVKYRIVFHSTRDGNYEIYVMNADGSEQTRLTYDMANDDTMPKASPDGSKIVFSKNYPSNIYTMNDDGSNVTPSPIATCTGTAGSSWSPDGRYIVYQKTLGQIHIMNPDGTGDAPLISANDPNVPSWSAKRNLIAFRASDGTQFDIYTTSPYPGAPITNLTNNLLNDESSPSWSPDGSKLIYSKRTGVGAGNYHLYIWDVTTNTSSVFFDSGTFSFTDDVASFSPDGEKIVFHSNFIGTNQIYVINADGTDLQQLTFSGTNESPSWVP